MRKSVVFTFAVLSMMIIFAGMGWAVDPKNTGCGLGSMVFEGQNGLMSQTAAATTNGIFGNQTFGITSGTLNCERYKDFAYNEKVDTFVAQNMDNLARDIARGQVREYALERVPGVGKAVQKQDGEARWVSLLDVGNLNPVGNLTGLDNECHFLRF